MTFAPLLQAPFAIQLHAFAAMGAFLIGCVQILGPKGTMPHRTLGYLWAALMLIVSITSFWIQDIKQFGNFSWIHLLSVLSLVMLPIGLLYAHRHKVRGHAITMISLFFGALLIAGAFTLLPGRIMGRVVFGS